MISKAEMSKNKHPAGAFPYVKAPAGCFVPKNSERDPKCREFEEIFRI